MAKVRGKRRVGKEHLALAVRKNFKERSVVEAEATACFLYAVRHRGKVLESFFSRAKGVTGTCDDILTSEQMRNSGWCLRRRNQGEDVKEYAGKMALEGQIAASAWIGICTLGHATG